MTYFFGFFVIKTENIILTITYYSKPYPIDTLGSKIGLLGPKVTYIYHIVCFEARAPLMSSLESNSLEIDTVSQERLKTIKKP